MIYMAVDRPTTCRDIAQQRLCDIVTASQSLHFFDVAVESIHYDTIVHGDHASARNLGELAKAFDLRPSLARTHGQGELSLSEPRMRFLAGRMSRVRVEAWQRVISIEWPSFIGSIDKRSGHQLSMRIAMSALKSIYAVTDGGVTMFLFREGSDDHEEVFLSNYDVEGMLGVSGYPSGTEGTPVRNYFNAVDQWCLGLAPHYAEAFPCNLGDTSTARCDSCILRDASPMICNQQYVHQNKLRAEA